MELKKLIKDYVGKCTPLKNIEFVEPTDVNDGSIKLEASLLRVSIEWQNDINKVFAFPITINQLDVVHMLHSVCIEYYIAQQNKFTAQYTKRNKIDNTPTIILPNDLSIIN